MFSVEKADQVGYNSCVCIYIYVHTHIKMVNIAS